MAVEALQMLVAPKVSEAKFLRELANWDANAAAYRRRGWLLVARDERSVDVAFIAKVPLAGQVIEVVAATVRIDFSNYDLWAPSVTFIDIADGVPWGPPMRAVIESADGPRDLLVDQHPLTGRPFLCVPGTREYHSHPQHSGDDWLLHRGTGAGRLIPLCDLLWRTMAGNVIGAQANIQTVGAAVQVVLRVVQGELSAVAQPGAAS